MLLAYFMLGVGSTTFSYKIMKRQKETQNFPLYFPFPYGATGGIGARGAESMRTDFHFDQLNEHYGFDEEMYPELDIPPTRAI